MLFKRSTLMAAGVAAAVVAAFALIPALAKWRREAEDKAVMPKA